MCDTCGCNVTPGNEHLVAAGGHLAKTASGSESVEVLKGLLDANDHQAAHNREHFARHSVLAINLMSSPGAGKTALLEASIDALGADLKIAVIEGDLETENDAERIRRKGVPAVQISTGSACHLDAHMVHTALHELDLDDVDVVFFHKAINVQGSDHHGTTIARVRAGLQASHVGVPPAYPEYVLHKMVTVMKGGEEVKISKRAGGYVTLRDLIEWTSKDAVRFFLTSRKADTEFTFDVDLALQQNDENPVFYVQYAHARICSVLQQHEQRSSRQRRRKRERRAVACAADRTQRTRADAQAGRISRRCSKARPTAWHRMTWPSTCAISRRPSTAITRPSGYSATTRR